MATCGREVHVGDIGTVFEITLYDCDQVVNLFGATTQEIIFLRPDSTKLIKTSSFTTDGTDGVIRCLSVSGDLNQSGKWKIQGHVVLPSGEWWSDIGSFRVYANL